MKDAIEGKIVMTGNGQVVESKTWTIKNSSSYENTVEKWSATC